MNRPSILGLAAIAVLSTAGCRGSSPFGSMVNVTRDEGAIGPEIEAPQQRLALAKRRSNPDDPGSDPQSSLAVAQTSATESSDPIARRESTRLASKRSLSAIPTETAAEPAVSRRANANSTDAGANQAKADTTNATELTLPSSEEIANVQLPAGNAEELMVAFKDYPPEVQREALRRLVAATAQSAERSSQPASVTTKLAERLSDSNLPELPESSATRSDGPVPQRIGAEQPKATSVVSAAMPAKNTTDPTTSATSDVSELQTAELEPIAQTEPVTKAVVADLTQQPGIAQGSDSAGVQPAFASTSNDASSVAQASIEKEVQPVAESPRDGRQGEPREFLESLNSGELFGQLVEKLAVAPAGESEADRASRLIKLRHLMVLSGDPDGAVEQIEGMSETEQEYLRHQLLGLWTMIDPQGHPVPSRRFSTAIPQIREAAKFAAAATDSLEVRSLAFCTEIESYGQIKPFKSNRFDAGQQVILYCEIENFTAEETEEGFQTHLQGSYDLFNENDEKIVSQLLPADQQVSANYLRDYFIAYQMHLPEQLSKGKYRLQLTMEDVNGKKYGQANIAVEIKR